MRQLFGEAPTKLIGLGILLLLLLLLVLTIRVLLVPFVAALFVTYLFDPAVVSLQQRGMERGKAYILLLALSVLGITALIFFGPAWLRLESMTGAGHFTDRFQVQLTEFERWVDRRAPPMVKAIDISGAVTRRIASLTSTFLSDLPALFTNTLINILLVPFISYFMIRDGKTLRRRFIHMIPNRYFEMALIMMHRIDGQIGGYLRGRLIECSLAGATQMLLMGVAALFVPQPQILLISTVIGVTNLIPYVGPLLGGGFGVFLYLGAGLPMSSIWYLVATIAIAHLIDNIIIAPAVLSHNVDLHPLTVVLVLIIGGEAMGVLGLLIAVPVAASIKVVAQEFYANYQIQVR